MAAAPRGEPAAPAPFADPNPPAAPSGRPFDMPAMLRPGMPGGNIEWFGQGHDDDQDEALESLLPPRMPTRPPATIGVAATTPFAGAAFPDSAADYLDAELDDEDEDEALSVPDDQAIEQPERFSSLLDMKPPARPAPGPLAEAPVRLPGGYPASEPVVTEDALRNALAALQRMSGAA